MDDAKKANVAIAMLKLSGILLIVLGVLLIIGYGGLPFVGDIYKLVGIILIVIGILWYRKIARAVKKLKEMSDIRLQALIAVAVLVPFFLAPLAHAQSNTTATLQPTKECVEMYRRVVFMEYFMVGITLALGFVALSPMMLSRTVLGPIFQEISHLAGEMLLILIFLLLVLFPLDPMFQFPEGPETCYIDIKALRDHGPPIMQIILKLLWPPSVTWSTP